jgi:hypothetical protein
LAEWLPGITSPRAEIVVSFQVTSETRTSPVRLTGRIEEFDPGPGAKVYALNEEESKPVSLTAFNALPILAFFRTRVQGQPIDVSLSNLELRGFAIRQVSPLDPSGWIKVQLVRTSASPAAGLQ